MAGKASSAVSGDTSGSTARSLVGVSLAAALDQAGTYGWAAAGSSGILSRGTVKASSWPAADAMIARELAKAFPAGYDLSFRLWAAGAQRHAKRRAATRPYHVVSVDDAAPACAALRRIGVRLPRRREIRELYAKADAGLPVVPTYPLMTAVEIPEGDNLSGWTVATDASVRDGQGAWAFVTGAGWADADTLPALTTPTFAEFSAYCRALALFPEGAAVTLITDNQGTAGRLREIITAPSPAGLFTSSDPEVSRIFQMTVYYARRLRLSVEWRKRNTHPLQAKADRLCRKVLDDAMTGAGTVMRADGRTPAPAR